jgi:16S rRNA C1402 N4-methylase RsmH
MILTKKGISAGEEEIRKNPASRSARFRAVEKILDEEGL